MKIARVSRVAIVWAMCLQLLVAPWAVAIEPSEQNNDPLVTSDKVSESPAISETAKSQDDELTTDDVATRLVDDSDVNNTTIIQSFGEESIKADSKSESDDEAAAENNTLSGIIITQVQTSGGSGHASEELIEIRNNSNSEIDITNWEIYSNDSAIYKVVPAESEVGYLVLLPAGATMILATPDFIKAHTKAPESGLAEAVAFAVDAEFVDGITNANGSVRIYDDKGIYISGVAWGAGIVADGAQTAPLPSRDGGVIERLLAESGWHQDTLDNNRDFTVGQLRDEYKVGFVEEVFDACLNIELIQAEIPEGLYRDEMTGACSDVSPSPPPQVNQCERLVLSEIGANLGEQFIEIHNPSDETLELGGCRLLTNRSDTKYHVFDDEQLAAGAYKSVAIPQEADLTLTKTTSGTVYLVSEDGLLEVDSVSYANLRADTSWALVGEEWHQTYSLTPGEPNIYEQFLPCDEGHVRNAETGRCVRVIVLGEAEPCAANQYRNPDTGRCRLIEVGSTLAPCREDQYRHPETNRCRSLESTVSTLVPCSEGQERNPETNRCRAIASAANSLTPCQEGQERNPETNRCRKIASLTTLTDFPVEPIVDTSKGFAAWWTLGGVTLLGVGYGAWEWRRELAAGMRRVSGMMSK